MLRSYGKSEGFNPIKNNSKIQPSENYTIQCEKIIQLFPTSNVITSPNDKSETFTEKIYYLHDLIKCLKENEINIPSNMFELSTSKFKLLEELSMQSQFGAYWNDRYTAKLRIQAFLIEIVNIFYQISKDNGRKEKFFIYSGSDDTLASILTLFNAFNQQSEWPGFGSNIIFELFEDQEIVNKNLKSFYVRMMYNTKPIIFQKTSSYKNKHEFCRLDEFLNWMNSNIFI
jgi:hypothetical protein